MLIVKEAVFLLLAFLDMLFTEAKILDYGIEIELNPVIRKLILFFARFMRGQWAVGWGIYLGIGLPTLGIMCLGWKFPDILAFVLGCRFTLFLFQQQVRFQNAESKHKDSVPD